MPNLLLRIEGLTIMALSIYFYYYMNFSWLIFIVLLLTPDLATLGYLTSMKIGSILYNLFHTYSTPTIILLISLFINNEFILMISLIWFAHIGMDRMFGYGLKYATNFRDTHLNRV